MTKQPALSIHTLTAPAPTQREQVLLIHGFASTPALNWERTRWISQLSPHYDLHLVTLPWHQLQESPAPSTWEQTAHIPLDLPPGSQALATITEALAHYLTSPSYPTVQTHLIGFSLGARIAWDLASTHPRLAASLTTGGMPLSNHLPDIAHLITHPNPQPPADSPRAHLAAVLSSTPIPHHQLLPFTQLTLPTFTPTPHPTCPILLFAGSDDPLAAASTTLSTQLPAGQAHLHLEPRRNHISILTSGTTRRKVTSFLLNAPSQQPPS